MRMTVAIPTSDMNEKEHYFTRLLDSLWYQTFQDFDIMVTDNSEDDVIKDVCEFYRAGITYYKNPIKGMAQNTNEAIKRSTGELIKILYMDDFLYHERALERISKAFSGYWLVTGCNHTENGLDFFNPHKPVYSEDIHLGNNTIGSPSVLTIKNENPLLFDEEMTWLLDVDLYKRYYDAYGPPVILNDISTSIGLHEGQATHTMGDARKLQEQQYILNKYNG